MLAEQFDCLRSWKRKQDCKVVLIMICYCVAYIRSINIKIVQCNGLAIPWLHAIIIHKEHS